MEEDEFKQQAKIQSIQIAERINPTTYNNQGGLGGQSSKPSIDAVLSDAEKIYQWLTKQR